MTPRKPLLPDEVLKDSTEMRGEWTDEGKPKQVCDYHLNRDLM